MLAAALFFVGASACTSVDDLKAQCENGNVASCERACEKGVGGKKGCLTAAEARRTGSGAEKDIRGALALAERACDSKERDGCALAARMLAKGEGAEVDKRRAAELYGRACDLGSPTSCFDSGFWFAELSPPAWDLAVGATAKGCRQLGSDPDGAPGKPPCREMETLKSHRERVDRGAGASPPGSTASAGRAPAVHVEEARVDGPLDPIAVQVVVRKSFARFRACYETALPDMPDLHGRVETRFKIGIDGTVAASASTGDLTSPAVAKCVEKIYAGLSFPTSTHGPSSVTSALVFTPGG
jgi:hypothetical protein